MVWARIEPWRFAVRKSSLVNMTIDALIAFRDNADRIIKTRAKSERKALEKQLSRLGSYDGLGAKVGRKRRGSPLRGRKVAPKYRNPANKSETWAGRGVRPRWLQAALKKGHKIDEFAIAKPTRQAATRKRRGGAARRRHERTETREATRKPID
jgi:DNA-binding protein H-NS